MLRCFLILKNKITKLKGEDIMINKTRLRAYAKTIQNGTRTIDEVPEEYRVPVYIELIAGYNWTIDMVDERYKEEVKQELGIYEVTM